MLRLVGLTFLLISELAVSTTILAAKQQRHAGKSFISTLQFKHVLRVCNAYPYTYPMDIYLGKEKLTESSMAYKSCDEFTEPLNAGDKFDFRVGDSSAGSFSLVELPNNDAVLLLVIY